MAAPSRVRVRFDRVSLEFTTASGTLRVVEDVLGHLGLFGIAPTYMPQIDHHLADLLATEV